jgi:hypothetical protein
MGALVDAERVAAAQPTSLLDFVRHHDASRMRDEWIGRGSAVSHVLSPRSQACLLSSQCLLDEFSLNLVHVSLLRLGGPS